MVDREYHCSPARLHTLNSQAKSHVIDAHKDNGNSQRLTFFEYNVLGGDLIASHILI